MNNLLIATLLALSFPLSTHALQPRQNGYGLPFDKNRKIENLAKDQNSKESERAKVEAIITNEKMQIEKFELNPPKSTLNKEQLAKFEELYQQHNFVQSLIQGGSSQQ